MNTRFRYILLIVVLQFAFAGVDLAGQQLTDKYLRFGASFGTNFGGDEITQGIGDYKVAPFGELFLDMPVINNLGIRVSGFWGNLSNAQTELRSTKLKELAFDAFEYETTFFGGMIGPAYGFDPLFLGLQPTVFVRAGVIRMQTSYSIEETPYDEKWTPVLAYGFGATVDLPITNALAFSVTLSGNFMNTDKFDGFVFGFKNDGFSAISAGFSWFLVGGNEEVPTLPEAVYSSRGPADRSTMEPDVTDAEDAAQVQLTLETDRFFKSSELLVETTEFTSFEALQRNPRDLRITNTQDQAFPSPLDVQVEFIHKGKVIARSTKLADIPRGTKELNANDLIDFDNIEVDPAYKDELPKGNYVLRLSVQPETRTRELAENEPFQILKLNETFADSAYKVYQMIDQGKVEAMFTDDDQMVISTYAVNTPFIRNTSAVNKEIWERSQRGETPKVSTMTAEEMTPEMKRAASIVPGSLTGQDANQYVREVVKTSFENAARLVGMNRNKVPVVVVELFFAFDDAKLSEENRVILDQVAIELLKRPEFNLELRGYADDVGETLYNLNLSRQRAGNARDYLFGKNVRNNRLTSEGFGKIKYLPVESSEWRQRARKVEILLTK